MKNKNINNLIIEGADGVGKTTLIMNLFKHYNYRYMCYHRGEISNYIFAKKYGRPFTSTQRGLPFLYIVLLCDEKVLRKRIRDRGDSKTEQAKASDNKLFAKAAKEFSNDFDVFTVDTTHLTEDEVCNKVCEFLDNMNSNETQDENLSEWNQRYVISCKKYGLEFKVINNQPYINNIPLMVESTVGHNGVYETFDDKRFPFNLLYSLSYDKSKLNISKKKKYKFNYVINSKIKHRPEIFDYYNAFTKNKMSCLISDNPLVKHNKYLVRMDRKFGEDYINEISKADATVYSARDLSYLELQTGRLFESIIADNIIFVDKESDKDCKLLKAMHHGKYLKLLYVTPETICHNYNKITKEMRNNILEGQRIYYRKLIRKLGETKWKL